MQRHNAEASLASIYLLRTSGFTAWAWLLMALYSVGDAWCIVSVAWSFMQRV